MFVYFVFGEREREREQKIGGKHLHFSQINPKKMMEFVTSNFTKLLMIFDIHGSLFSAFIYCAIVLFVFVELRVRFPAGSQLISFWLIDFFLTLAIRKWLFFYLWRCVVAREIKIHWNLLWLCNIFVNLLK